MTTDPDAAGEALYEAYIDRSPLDSTQLPALSIEDGYRAQQKFIDRRLSAEGPVVGYKIGFTNETVQSELGVSEPCYGQLLAGTVREERQFSMDELCTPRIEPEIAFVLGEPLDKSASRLDVLAATECVVPGIEVVDSRITDWELTAGTAIADNALAARLLPGEQVASTETALHLESVEVLIDGERRVTGTGAAVLGHPADAVAWLANELADNSRGLQAGDIVTTGSLTEPIPVTAGETVVARFGSLGTVVAHAAER